MLRSPPSQWWASSCGSAWGQSAHRLLPSLLREQQLAVHLPSQGLHRRDGGLSRLRATSSGGGGDGGPSLAAQPPPPPRRLYSRLDERLRHQPGSVAGSALLIAGTTVGAGILALPAVTQDAGFAASAITLTGGAAFSIATGLLVAEVSVMTMCELGGGGVSLSAMARRTLGPAGTAAAGAAYVFLHQALLVAYITKAGEILSASVPGGALPEPAADVAFVAAFGGLCALASVRALDAVNGALVAAVVATFAGLVAAAAPSVDAAALARADWSAVPATLPVVALAFVYHNVVPVVVSNLEGDVARVRTAIVTGVAVPWLMFIVWDGAILGSLDNLAAAAAATTRADADAGSSTSSIASTSASSIATTLAAAPPLAGDGVALSSSSPSSPTTTTAPSSRVDDPLAALATSSGAVGPLVRGFSFLAVATSFIGFVIGFEDFISSVLSVPRRSATAYALTLLPPLAAGVALGPELFVSALDAAGTYGVLTLFGIVPVAMAWSERYGRADIAPGGPRVEAVPGGKPVLFLVGGAAAAVIVREAALAVAGALDAGSGAVG